jgi:hypothetical protein
MPKYRIHLSVEPDEPMPLTVTLPEVEADDPVSAAEILVRQGRYSQTNLARWARVVTENHPNGMPKKAVRVPLDVDSVIPLVSLKRDDDPIF